MSDLFNGFKLMVALLLIFASLNVYAARLHHEYEYQTDWCESAGGVSEVVLEDLTRVDCLTDTHAIEFDFANKWAEAIGQSLGYSVLTGRAPGIVLIIEKQRSEKYLRKLKRVIDQKRLGIDVWVIRPES